MKATILLFGCLLVGADAGVDVVKKDMALIEGSWNMVSGTQDGAAVSRLKTKMAHRVVKDGVTTVTGGGSVILKASYTIDPSKKPKAIDYVMTEGENKGKTQLGIYEIDGDTIKLCMSAPGKERPTDFSSKPGSGRTLSVWQREKK